MQTLTVSNPFPFPGSNSRLSSPLLGLSQINRFASAVTAQISIRSPPLEFDYRAEMTAESRMVVAASHPELMDLVDEGMLVLVEKRRFGPVPEWRRDFVEPEAIWLVGTSHVSQKSVADVERVIRALRPDNVVVELCRSSLLGFTDFVMASGSVQPSKSDLQIYLEEGLYLCNSTEFDVLEWWQSNTLKYPFLSKMAKDVLTIPITTVASESAFSAGGRVLDDYRSSLSTKTVNALVCTSSWLRSSQNSIKTHLHDIEAEENLCVPLPEI